MKQPLKIIRLEAENIKKLVAVEVTPDGSVVEITGRNGSGKTSLLDAIWWALAGTKPIQKNPIRAGQQKAVIKVDLGSLKITRKFAAKEEGGFTTSITVESEDGAQYKKPQEILDSLLGSLSLDPLAFTRMKPKEQFDALKAFVPGIDFDAIEVERQKDFDARTDVNRRAGQVRAQADGIAVPDGTPAQPVNVSELSQEIERALENNNAIGVEAAARDRTRSDIGSAKRSALGCEERIADMRRQIAAEETRAAEFNRRAIELEAALESAKPLPEPIDVAPIRARIADAERINAAVANRKRKTELEAESKRLEEQSDALTKQIAARDAAKAKAVAEAKLPIDGISFGDGALLLNGQPFDQASDAEQLRASIAIAAAMNPRLRVIRVRDGSLLDDDSMRLLADMAEKLACQVWIETVASDRPGAIVLEGGMVRRPIAEAAE